jgi:hypothetical protein
LLLLAGLAVIVLAGGTALSYYVESLWFTTLGFSGVFWRTLNFQAAVFAIFAVVTFLALYGSFLALKPERLGDLADYQRLTAEGKLGRSRSAPGGADSRTGVSSSPVPRRHKDRH